MADTSKIFDDRRYFQASRNPVTDQEHWRQATDSFEVHGVAGGIRRECRMQESMDPSRCFTKRWRGTATEVGTWHLLLWPSWSTIPDGADREYWSQRASHIHFICNKTSHLRRKTDGEVEICYAYQIVKAALTVRRHGCPTFPQSWMVSNYKPFHVEAQSSRIMNVARDTSEQTVQEYDFIRSMQPSPKGPLERACAWWCFDDEAMSAQRTQYKILYFDDMMTEKLPEAIRGWKNSHLARWGSPLFERYREQWQALIVRAYQMLNAMMPPSPATAAPPLIGSGTDLPPLSWDMRLLSSNMVGCPRPSPLDELDSPLRNLEKLQRDLHLDRRNVRASANPALDRAKSRMWEAQSVEKEMRSELEKQDAQVVLWARTAIRLRQRNDMTAVTAEAKAHTATTTAAKIRRMMGEVTAEKRTREEEVNSLSAGLASTRRTSGR